MYFILFRQRYEKKKKIVRYLQNSGNFLFELENTSFVLHYFNFWLSWRWSAQLERFRFQAALDSAVMTKHEEHRVCHGREDLYNALDTFPSDLYESQYV